MSKPNDNPTLSGYLFLTLSLAFLTVAVLSVTTTDNWKTSSFVAVATVLTSVAAFASGHSFGEADGRKHKDRP